MSGVDLDERVLDKRKMGLNEGGVILMKRKEREVGKKAKQVTENGNSKYV